MKIRTTLLAIFSLITLVGLNFLILQKETMLRQGKTIILKLAPVDPRSLLQGDYMRLDYEINRAISHILYEQSNTNNKNYTGYVVVRVAQDHLATFQRIHDPSIPLAPEEQLLKFKRRDWRVQLGAESFFFQEGHAKYYEKAQYGELKVTASGNTLLCGLRDENMQPIVVKEKGDKETSSGN